MINKEQAKAYIRQWEAIAEVEKKELRSFAFSDRLIQTLSLMGLGFSMAAHELIKIEEDSDNVKKVRNLWITIKEKTS